MKIPVSSIYLHLDGKEEIEVGTPSRTTFVIIDRFNGTLTLITPGWRATMNVNPTDAAAMCSGIRAVEARLGFPRNCAFSFDFKYEDGSFVKYIVRACERGEFTEISRILYFQA